eukprot:m.62515 g.62515  ORF g.62515 m.62515 type:complete len:499 (-) comp8033_c4_seq2:73-1569(-)
MTTTVIMGEQPRPLLLVFSIAVCWCGFILPFAGCTEGTRLIVDKSTARLKDSTGHEVIFHGVNVVYKGPPYVPIIDHFDYQYSFSEEDAKILNQYGMNAIRLGMMWPGVEPTRNQYNQTYLDMMKNITKMCEDHGIWVLLDFHQDVWNERFCGEGVPAWAASPSSDAKPFPIPIGPAFNTSNPDGIPSDKDCSAYDWSEYYFTSAVGSSVQRLYNNDDGLLDSFAAFWGKVAQEFKAFGNILGYELINEPWAGDATNDLELMIPGVADRKNLQHVYDTVNTAIRAADQENLIFFETVTWDDVVVGFEHAPGGEEWGNRSILAYHFYQPPNLSPNETINVHLRAANRLSCGIFCSETDNMNTFIDAADGQFQSWLHWEYKAFIPKTGSNYGFWNQDGSINNQSVHALTRTYASSIAGKGVSMSFNSTTAAFSLSYITDPSVEDGTTTVFASKAIHYPTGVDVLITPEGALSWSVSGNIYSFKATDTSKAQFVSISLTKS